MGRSANAHRMAGRRVEVLRDDDDAGRVPKGEKDRRGRDSRMRRWRAYLGDRIARPERRGLGGARPHTDTPTLTHTQHPHSPAVEGEQGRASQAHGRMAQRGSARLGASGLASGLCSGAALSARLSHRGRQKRGTRGAGANSGAAKATKGGRARLQFPKKLPPHLLCSRLAGPSVFAAH